MLNGSTNELCISMFVLFIMLKSFFFITYNEIHRRLNLINESIDKTQLKDFTNKFHLKMEK